MFMVIENKPYRVQFEGRSVEELGASVQGACSWWQADEAHPPTLHRHPILLWILHPLRGLLLLALHEGHMQWLAEGVAGSIGLDGTQVLGLLDQHMQLAALGSPIRFGGHRLDTASKFAQIRRAACDGGATREERGFDVLRGNVFQAHHNITSVSGHFVEGFALEDQKNYYKASLSKGII